MLVGLAQPLGYNRLVMDRLPLHQRPQVIALIGSLAAGAVYYGLSLDLAETGLDALPLAPIVLILASALLIGLIGLSISLLMTTVQETSAMLMAFLRLILFTAWLFFHVQLLFPDALPLWSQVLLYHLDLALLSLVAMLALASQFVLPVERLDERWAAFRRLLGYVLGERGPVTFIRAGLPIEAHGERRRSGPGVFLIDHASAIVLRTETVFTRAAGPGIVFSRSNERLAEAVDLRPQRRVLRGAQPQLGDALTEDALSTMGITLDGIPVSVDLQVDFIIDPGHMNPPRLGRDPDLPPYEFEPASVEKAVFAHAFGEKRDVPWSELPLRLVVDGWREEIKSWPLKQLLDRGAEGNPLERIRGAIEERLIPSPDSEAEPSREETILSSRGVRILSVNLADLRLPPEIEAERRLQWREAWSGEVEAALEGALNQVREQNRAGETAADALLCDDLTRTLRRDLATGKRIDSRDALADFLSDATELLQRVDLSAVSAETTDRLKAMLSAVQTPPAAGGAEGR